MQNRYLRVGDVARMTNLHDDTVRSHAKSGKLKAHRFGPPPEEGEVDKREFRFLLSDVREWFGAPLIGADI